MSVLSRMLCIAILVALGVGCAPTLRVSVLQPAPVNLGAGRRLSVVQTVGRRSAREYVISQLIAQSRITNFFVAQDRSEEGIEVKVLGQRVEVSGGKGPAQTPDEVALRIDVLGWDAKPERRTYTEKVPETVKEKDAQGKEVEKTVYHDVVRDKDVLAAKVVLGVTAFNVQGRAFLAEREYEGRFDSDRDREDPALQAAARIAVTQLLRDVTPTYAEKYIRMDDEDERQKPIIKIAADGNVGFAIEEMQRYVKDNPNRGSALYNLAVLLDASGRYQEALDLYTQALRLSTKDFYIEMKGECARRFADQQALSQ